MLKNETWEGVDFPNVTFINMEDVGLTFDKAQEAARRVAKNYDSDPLLLSWYDRKKGQESPHVSCGGAEPGWVTYGKSHGGCFTVNVNHGDYMFMYRCDHEFK